MEGKSITYKLGRSDRCAKSEFEFSRTFIFFWLFRTVIANGDLTLKTAISFFTLHKLLAKFGEKSRPDPDSACKRPQFEVPHDSVRKFRLILIYMHISSSLISVEASQVSMQGKQV